MPCRTDPEPPSFNAQRENGVLQSLLCSACRALEAAGFDFDLNPALSEWWAKHQAQDNLRLVKEAKERQSLMEAVALAGTKLVRDLSPDEKKLLRKHGII